MYNRVLPKFKEIANQLLDKQEAAETLELMYSQGYHAGRMDEAEEWYAEQDKEAVNAEKGQN